MRLHRASRQELYHCVGLPRHFNNTNTIKSNKLKTREIVRSNENWLSNRKKLFSWTKHVSSAEWYIYFMQCCSATKLLFPNANYIYRFINNFFCAEKCVLARACALILWGQPLFAFAFHRHESLSILCGICIAHGISYIHAFYRLDSVAAQRAFHNVFHSDAFAEWIMHGWARVFTNQCGHTL